MLYLQVDATAGGCRLLKLTSPNWIGELANSLDQAYEVVTINATTVGVWFKATYFTGRYMISHVFEVQDDWNLFMLAKGGSEIQQFMPSQAIPAPVTAAVSPPEVLKPDFVSKLCPEPKVGECVAHIGKHMVLSEGYLYNGTAFAGHVIELKSFQLEVPAADVAVEQAAAAVVAASSEDVSAPAPGPAESVDRVDPVEPVEQKVREEQESRMQKIKKVGTPCDAGLLSEVKVRMTLPGFGLRKLDA